MGTKTIHDRFISFYSLMKEGYYKELEQGGITNISDVKSDSTFSAGYLVEMLRKKGNINPVPYTEFKIYSELDFITQDLKYIIGILFSMKPYINNPVSNSGNYHQSMEDHIYLRYSTFGFQSVYNYWDRIGDLLYLYFQTGLKQEEVYFGRVLKRIKRSFKNCSEFQTFEEFYNLNIKDKLEKRHYIVHQFQLKSEQFYQHFQFYKDNEKQSRLFDEKLQYFDDLKDQLLYCLEGYKLALKLLSILPDKIPG